MRSGTYKHIEQILKDHPYIDRYIKEREDSISYPYVERDNNVGGGKAQFKNNEGTARVAITIATDKEIIFLKYTKRMVDECLEETDEDTLEIIQELYFKKRSTMTLTGLGRMLNLSRSQVARKRSDFLKR
ncbi:transcriptional regulator [Lentilactobacillus kosonis]|uniref:Integrase regulator RinA n=1 Tax=Lentilactobacillus kosonis TaxID=2810561 RepID=A0A401FQ30_9LACO|nr:transcriptional regulator [Lentilactobacillus kosonis]GAY74331.1 integrase regulator RinA [Lentilactobacillus kosonis]